MKAKITPVNSLWDIECLIPGKDVVQLHAPVSPPRLVLAIHSRRVDDRLSFAYYSGAISIEELDIVKGDLGVREGCLTVAGNRWSIDWMYKGRARGYDVTNRMMAEAGLQNG